MTEPALLFCLLPLLASGALAQRPAPPPTSQTDLRGGDAPYLLEPGWKPLIVGTALAGWHGRTCADEPIDRGDRPPCCVRKLGFDWIATSGVMWNAGEPGRLAAGTAVGDRLLNGPKGSTQDLVTDQTFGDVELYLEFMVARKSNSGVYLQGHYEVQIFDSFGAAIPTYSDAGGIYEGFSKFKKIPGRFSGSPPRENASRRPGEWQSYLIWFQAPRFDASGAKIANARFLRVWHNGVLVQSNIEVDEPTVSAMGTPEAPLGPLVLQGDHGPVALRNIYIRALRARE
jgi:hypothetical protein